MKDKEHGTVLLASAVVLLAGGVSIGMGGLIQALSRHRGLGYETSANIIGCILLTVGAITFLITYSRYYKNGQ
jgi:hypothetical protein